MDKVATQDNSSQLSDQIPLIIGNAAVEICLSSVPLVLFIYKLATETAKAHVSIANEKNVLKLLEDIKENIKKLEANAIIDKSKLKENLAYQEAANKRLVNLPPLANDEEIALIASLVSVCTMLDLNNSKDKFLLKALCELNPEDIKIFFLINVIQNKHKKLNRNLYVFNSSDVAKSAQVRSQLGFEFSKEANLLINVGSYTHILARLHSFGLIDPLTNSANTLSDIGGSLLPPPLTPLGEYLLDLLNK